MFKIISVPLQPKTTFFMKRVLFYLLVCLALASCKGTIRPDGIYPNETGWDIVDAGKVYHFKCQDDGLYLRIDFDGRNRYSMDIRYEEPIYRRTVGRMSDLAIVGFDFLRVNEKGQHVYVAGWEDFDGSLQRCKSIMFNLDADAIPIYDYRQNRQTFHLMEKYAH